MKYLGYFPALTPDEVWCWLVIVTFSVSTIYITICFICFGYPLLHYWLVIWFTFIDFDSLKVMIKKHTKLVVYLSCNILDLSIMWLSIPYHLFFWLIRSGSMLPKPVKHKRYGQKAASNKGDSFSGSFWSIYLNTRTWYASKDILNSEHSYCLLVRDANYCFQREPTDPWWRAY
jgi:hypothetical protein